MSNQDSKNQDPRQGEITLREAAFIISAQKQALDEAYKRHKELLAQVKESMQPGDKLAARSPEGIAIGDLQMTMPTSKAVCNDEAILAAMAEERGLEILDVLPRDDERLQELINYVFETRPDLLSVELSAEDKKSLSDEVLKKWVATGEVPTGWEIKESSAPQVRFGKAKTAEGKALIQRMLGELSPMLELESGKEII